MTLLAPQRRRRFRDPSVLLRMHAGMPLPNEATFARSSPATYFGADGILREAATNVPRVEWLDSATPAVLLEGGGTNGIRNPRCEGAVIGTLGSGGALPTFWLHETAAGLTWEVVATGVEDGLPYVDVRLHGTPSQAFAQLRFDGTMAIAAAPGEIWTGSCYVRRVGGSMVGIGEARVRIQERDASGAFLNQSQSVFDPDDSPRLAGARRTYTHTVSDPNAAAIVLMFGVSGMIIGNAVDVTFRIAGPQIERSPVASSLVLPPAGAPAASTRSADLLTAPWPWAPGPLSIYLRLVELGGLALPGYPVLVRIGDGDDRLQLQVDSALGRYQLRYTSGGVNRWRTLTTAPVAGQDVELMLTLSRDGVASLSQSIAGGPAETVASSPPLALPAAWESQTITVSGGRHAGRDLLVLDGADWTMDAVRRLLP